MSFPGGFQTTMVEFIVREALDGETPAPGLGPLLENQPLPAQGYRFEVDRLGYVDLSFDLPDPQKIVPVSTGWRYVPWMSIYGGNLFLLGASAGVGIFRFPDEISSYSESQELDLIGQPLTYSRKGYVIPPGATFRLNGISASPGNPIRVRMGVLLPRSEEEEQAIRNAFCCTADIPTIVVPVPPDDCPECDCPITGVTYTDDVGDPLSLPLDVPVDGVTDWIRVSSPQVNADTQVNAVAQSGPTGDIFVVDAEFLSETCEWRFRVGASETATPGVLGTVGLQNTCGDGCFALAVDFVTVVP